MKRWMFARSLARGATRALLTFALTVVGLLLITFLIQKASPIDPVLRVVGDHASPEAYHAVYVEMGMDRPLYVQFGRYLGKVSRGDLGVSTSTGRPVVEDLAQYFPATVELATVAIVLGVLFGVPLGMWAAQRHNGKVDQYVRVLSLVGYSVPIFWMGLMGLLLFYAKLKLVAGPGRIDDIWKYTLQSSTNFMLIDTLRDRNWEAMRNALSHLILPALLLAYMSMAYIARMTRAFVLEELGKEYVLFARVKGATETRLLWLHVLPNIAAPLVTVISLSYATLLEGAVLTESVFSWPGIGLYVTNALFTADVTAVLGGTLLIGFCFVALNAVSDQFGYWLDPRVR
ncbi:MAG TPA: ABC transporter permease [Holophaga sp.]|nr:ABC transporter permease [Holophaga sp.]HPS66724.1 ABC transporter permease [Holophaga sp.]